LFKLAILLSNITYVHLFGERRISYVKHHMVL